jgi:hypothetical protein
MVSTSAVQVACEVCTTTPARRANTGTPNERSYACCEDCDRIAQPDWAPPLPMPPIAQVRVIRALEERMRRVRFKDDDLETEAAAFKAVRESAARTLDFQRPKEVRWLAINEGWLRPDGALSFDIGHGRTQFIALEMKLLAGHPRDRAEIARGLGQCMQYGHGVTHAGEDSPYRAAVLILVDRARRKAGAAWTTSLGCIHHGHGDFFWLYRMQVL